MSLDIANSNVNRNLTLAGTSIAIFTFLLFFLYPRYSSGEINSILFQLTLSVIVSVLACRLHPAVAGAKPDSVYREPLSCWAICIDPLVFLHVPHSSTVQKTNQEKMIPSG
jgi:hypothetical protein